MSVLIARVAGGLASILLVFVSNYGICSAASGWTAIDRDPGVKSHWCNDERAIISDPNAPGRLAGSILVYNAETWGDHALGCRFMAEGAGGVGFIIRYQDPENYYRVALVSESQKGESSTRIEKCVNGRVTVLTRNNWTFAVGKWYTVGFGAVEDFLCIQVVDEIELVATDDAFSRGKVGVACFGGTTARFEALNVSTDGQSTVLLPLGIEGSPDVTPPGETAPSENSILAFADHSAAMPRLDLDVRFDGGDLRGWQTVELNPVAKSRWRINGNSLRSDRVVTMPAGKGGDTFLVVKDRSWDDFICMAGVKPTVEGGGGIVFRYTDPHNNYRAVLLGNAVDGGSVRLEKRVNGQMTLLDGSPWASYSDQYVMLAVVCEGSTITVYVDEEPYLSADDVSLPKGTVGLLSCASRGVDFDGIRVYIR